MKKELAKSNAFFPNLKEKIPNITAIFKYNSNGNKKTTLKNSSMEQNNVKGNQTIVKQQTNINNYYPIKKYKGNVKKFKNDIRNKKIVVFDSENNFPEQELLIKYGFTNIDIVSNLDELKKKQNIGAVIYRYRIKKIYLQKELENITCKFGFCFMNKKIEKIEKVKSKDNLYGILDFVSKLNIPFFVYSYPEKVENEDWKILTSYYFVVFSNFPLMLINHLKNILIILDKTK